MTDKDFHSCMESDGQSKEENETKEVDGTRPRYLYVSDGLVICCLDLQQNKRQPRVYEDADSVPGLPKVSILRMLDTGNPISAGLLKVDSDVYIIGGQVLSPGCANADPRVWGNYKYLIKKHGLKGLTCLIHCLSKVGSTLSLSGCTGIPELNEPKVWPIVEKIDGQIHVMSSLPLSFLGCYSEHTFTHEFLDLNEPAKGWTKVRTVGLGSKLNISSHLVVGDNIFATGSKNVMIYRYDEWSTRRKSQDFHPFLMKHVWDFLDYGHGRCAGTFFEEEGRSLFVVIAIVRDIAAPSDYSAHAVAYLVSSDGRVFCFQRLPYFFEDRLRPCLFKVAKMIIVDELGKTMCSIVQGRASGDFDGERYLFINTFSVEWIADACSKAHEIIEHMNKYSCAVEMEFVRVIAKDSYVYKMDKASESKGWDLADFSFLQALFL